MQYACNLSWWFWWIPKYVKQVYAYMQNCKYPCLIISCYIQKYFKVKTEYTQSSILKYAQIRKYIHEYPMYNYTSMIFIQIKICNKSEQDANICKHAKYAMATWVCLSCIYMQQICLKYAKLCKVCKQEVHMQICKNIHTTWLIY